jgi:hypothetical protein
MKKTVLAVFILFAFLATVAISELQANSSSSDSEQTICTDPRPEACTMDYRPVCGERDDYSYKTYSNGCNACSDPEVVGYVEGECRE